MSRVEIKKWAKDKIKGHVLELLVAIIVAGFLTKLTVGANVNVVNGEVKFDAGYPVGMLLGFIEVGFASYMLKFIHGKKYEIKELFAFVSDFVRIFVTNLLKNIFTFLWTLLFIIPGIIKAYGYSLTAVILASDKYKDLSYMDILKKSEELMKGHKMELFVLDLSFIGWHLLAILTLGFLEIWVSPYQTTAKYKFFDEILATDK